METSISSHIIDPHFRGIIGRYQPQLAEWLAEYPRILNYKGCKTMLNPSNLYMFDGTFHRVNSNSNLTFDIFPTELMMSDGSFFYFMQMWNDLDLCHVSTRDLDTSCYVMLRD